MRRWAPTALLAIVVAGVVVGLVTQTDGDHPAGDDPPPADDVGDDEADSEPPSADAPTEDRPAVVKADPPEESFAQQTGTVLLFDDGHDGALAVNLDTWQRLRVELSGQRPGDQPFRLGQLGDWVVVGSDEIWATLPGRPDEARRLGQATVFLPHAEPDALWLIDYSGGAVGQGTSTWTLIDPSGNALADVLSAPAGLTPVRGVPDGLAVRTAHGLLIYDLEQERLVENPIGAEARVADVTRQRVAWCDGDPCHQLLLTDEDGQLLTSIDDAATFHPDGVWLSPGGDRVAASVRIEVGEGADLRLRIYRTHNGERLADTQIALGALFGDWTIGGQFFAWNHMSGMDGMGPATLHRWTDEGHIEQVEVGEHGIYDVGDFIAMPARLVEDVFTSVQARSEE